jgi:hypothetical protein
MRIEPANCYRPAALEGGHAGADPSERVRLVDDDLETALLPRGPENKPNSGLARAGPGNTPV